MKYSVYVFLDVRDRPYYVGKTNNMRRRKKEHLAEIANGNPLPKYAMARRLIKQGHPLRMRAVAKATCDSDACTIESHLIKKYRKQGYKLYNLTSGGPDEKPTDLSGKPRKSKKVTAKTRSPVKPKRKKKPLKKKARKIAKKRKVRS